MDYKQEFEEFLREKNINISFENKDKLEKGFIGWLIRRGKPIDLKKFEEWRNKTS